MFSSLIFLTDLRLVGGPTSNKGTVEIRIDNGTWETICNDFYWIYTVIGICRKLGFAGASIAIKDTPYGQNSTPSGGLNCYDGKARCLLIYFTEIKKNQDIPFLFSACPLLRPLGVTYMRR